jgi:uncharacterized protein (DUF983 family)
MHLLRKLTFSEMFKGIFGNKCPRCLGGRVFNGIYTMHKECSHCGLIFEKEPGYFLGAIVIAYFVSAFSLVPTLVFSIFYLKLEIPIVLGIGITQIIILHPLLFHYSKLGWLYLESKLTSHLGDRDEN